MISIRHLLLCTVVAFFASFASAEQTSTLADNQIWVGTWSTAPQLVEVNNLPPAPAFSDTTLRQLLRVSLGGERLRVRFSNAFGREPLTIRSAHLARALGGSAIDAASNHALLFAGRDSVTIPPGALVVSDPLDFSLSPLADLAITLHVKGAPVEVTGHPGSRTTTYFQAGEAVSAADLPNAVKVDHWYFISGIEVLAGENAAAVAILGDSITDGRGSTTNGNDRWPDQLARRLVGQTPALQIAVLNQGIGGNCVFRGGLGPNALARLDRDVLAQPGVRWLIVFEGVNDVGGAAAARGKGEKAPTPADLIAALEQIIERARARGLRVMGATITPFGGSFYDKQGADADRQTVNQWIRSSGRFDAVIDFDAAIRDPQNPTRLLPVADCGDHLHLTPAGYKLLAEAVDLKLFKTK